MSTIRDTFRFLFRHHVFGSLAILLFVAAVIGAQIGDRHSFAKGELYQDVIDRWGAPIDQPAPSVRYARAGAVFRALAPLPLAAQVVKVDAKMSYRKRGLVYFSGFDFEFDGRFVAENPEPADVSLVFVFPIALEKNRVLLSDLRFEVDGQPASTALEGSDRLVWTGRLGPGASAEFRIRFTGRGLDSFVYRTDPALPVRGLEVAIDVSGGETYDYPGGVVPAARAEAGDGRVALAWSYASLESGVPVGAVLPAERAYDALIARMLRRAWAPFLLFALGLAAIGLWLGRPLERHESYLAAAGYASFYLVLAYFAAFTSFPAAYGLSFGITLVLLVGYLGRLFGPGSRRPLALSLGAFLLTPTLAVVFEGYTGLIYTLEILVGLATVMTLTSRPSFHRFLNLAKL